MKKLLSIALAVVMMMAVCVPAFAANPIVETGEQTGTADVYTTYDENTDWSYTVTIPADLEIPWGTTDAQNMTYKVESQLLIGASLKVSVAGSGTMAATGTAETLAYTLTGGDEVVFGEVNAANTTAPGVTDGTNAQVQITSFEGKPVGTYRDTLTYTVVYVAPTADATT